MSFKAPQSSGMACKNENKTLWDKNDDSITIKILSTKPFVKIKQILWMKSSQKAEINSNSLFFKKIKNYNFIFYSKIDWEFSRYIELELSLFGVGKIEFMFCKFNKSKPKVLIIQIYCFQQRKIVKFQNFIFIAKSIKKISGALNLNLMCSN